MKNALIIIGIFLLVGLVAAVITTLPTLFTAVRGATSSIVLSADGGEIWFALEQTEETKRLERADILALSFNPQEPALVYAGTRRKGLYKSTNGGASWSLVPAQNNVLRENATVRGISFGEFSATTQTLTEVIYVAVKQNSFGRILKSEDGGQTFSEVYTTTGEASLMFVKPDPINSNVVWAGTSEGLIIQSNDKGETWRRIHQLDAVPHTLVRNPANGVEVLVATFKDGIFYSPDAGVTWQERKDALDLFDNAEDTTALAQDETRPQTLYLASEFGLLRSENFGRTWFEVPLTIPEDDTVFTVAVAPTARNVLYAAAGRNLYISNDQGATWRVRHLAVSRFVTKVAPHPANPAFVLAGTHN